MAEEKDIPTAATGVDFTTQLELDRAEGVLQGVYPNSLGTPGPFEKWMLFEVKSTRHVGRNGTASGKPFGEGTPKDSVVGAVALYLPESALKSDIDVAYDKADIGPLAGVAAEHFAQTGELIGPLIQAGTDVIQGGIDLFDPAKSWTDVGKDVKSAGDNILNSIKDFVRQKNLIGNNIKQGATAVVLDVAGQTFGDAATQMLGVRVNPRTDMLFNHVEYRSHALDFMLIPRTLDEAKTIDTIVHFFQYYMLPSYSPNLQSSGSQLTGMLMGFPYEFEITFWSQSKSADNKHHINKIGRSVLSSVSVNHAAAGKVAFFKAGDEVYPAATSLSLRFQEIRLLGRDSTEIDRAGNNTAYAFNAGDPNMVEAPSSANKNQTVAAPGVQRPTPPIKPIPSH